MKKTYVYIAALVWTCSIGAIALPQIAGSKKVASAPVVTVDPVPNPVVPVPDPKPIPPSPKPVGDEVKLVTDENPIPAGSMAVVKITGLVAAESAIFSVTPDPKKQIDIESGIAFNGLDSKYTVEAFIVNFETRKIYKKKVVVSFAQNPQPPPVPVPVDPVIPVDPEDALSTSIKSAFKSCTETDKLALVKSFAEIMDSVQSIKDTGLVTTEKKLQDTMRNATWLKLDGHLPSSTTDSGKIQAVRKSVGAYLASKLGTADKPVDDAFWSLAIKEHNNVSKVLKGLK